MGRKVKIPYDIKTALPIMSEKLKIGWIIDEFFIISAKIDVDVIKASGQLPMDEKSTIVLPLKSLELNGMRVTQNKGG